jgi:hypothetical protein
VNLCDREKLELVEAFIGQINILSNGKDTKRLELVVELLHDDDVTNCGYYYADHESRSLLWLEEHDISDHLSQIKGAKSSPHIRMAFPAFLLPIISQIYIKDMRSKHNIGGLKYLIGVLLSILLDGSNSASDQVTPCILTLIQAALGYVPKYLPCNTSHRRRSPRNFTACLDGSV